ncbi:MAG: putative quinol monooxygenase [Nocardioides sp.]
MTDSAPLRVVATLPFDPASSAEVAPALTALATASQAEEGCLAYDVFESAATPGTFVTVESWRSQADMDSHMTQPHVATAFATLGPLLAGDLAIHPLTPL